MAESSLAVAYKELQQKLGEWLGYGRGADADEREWSDNQSRLINQFIKEGLHDFYFCGHDWSFLRPVVELTLHEGETTVDLPDDLGGVEGRIAFSAENGAGRYPLDFGPVGFVDQKAAEFPTTTGSPQYCCIEPVRGTTLTRSTRERLRFWPIADQDYTLRFQYFVNPDMLSSNVPYAWGGAQHSHTLLQACKAAAERHDGLPASAPEQMQFKSRLNASITIDARNKPQSFGYNTDRSDMREWKGRRNPFGLNTITFAGVEPD